MIEWMWRSFFLLFVLMACDRSRLAEVDRTEFVFGSYVRIKALAVSKVVAESAVGLAFEEMYRLDTLWSAFLPGSEVARLNESRAATVSPETGRLIEATVDACAATGGALDITVLPLSEAWGFLGGRRRVPDSAELAAAVELVDYRNVGIEGDSVFLCGGARIELGSVAVGEAVDRGVRILKDAGVEQGLVDAGGDIRVFGDRVWRIGLQNPRGDGVIRVFELRNRSVSTSGDYQKFFESDGQRYHHILDPKTGCPARGCASVTVFAQSALAVDAYSTAVFVLGPERGLEFVRQQESLGVVMLVADGDSVRSLEAGRLE